MKKILLLTILLTGLSIEAQSVKFKKGVNLTNWFQAGSPGQIQFSKYTKEDLIDIKSLGVDVIRLPINLEFMSNGSPDYQLEPLFYYFLDQVVNWCEELNIHLILDNHTVDVTIPTPVDYNRVLIPLWKQMAEHYKNRSDKILYEVLNEPHGISDADWNRIQAEVVDSIRSVDNFHTIIVGPAGWNNYNNLQFMPEFQDSNLIYTFHFYDPFIFTHQGASWVDPSLVPLAGLPFPYDASRMPDIPPSLVGTWVESNISDYQYNGTIQKVRDQLSIAVNFSDSRGVPVYCGELGVLMNNAPDNDRVLWYSIVSQYLGLNDIPFTMWDYKGGFGLFEKNSNELFDYDLNVFLLQALGFNVPPQSEFQILPDSTGFSIYEDYVGKNINFNYSGAGTMDLYNGNSYEGDFALYWSGATQFNTMNFNFVPNKDLTLLVTENYVVSLWVKGDNASTNFDLRFVDTKTGDDDHPWRMNFRVDNSSVEFDGQWHKVEVPLSSFTEQGSWDGSWFPPEGKFDWGAVDNFQIVSESGNLAGELWIDNIQVYNPALVGVHEDYLAEKGFILYQNYPNPFNPSTEVAFQIPAKGKITARVFNTLGQQVDIIAERDYPAGISYIEWNAGNFSSGVYFLNLEYNNGTAPARKIIKMNLMK